MRRRQQSSKHPIGRPSCRYPKNHEFRDSSHDAFSTIGLAVVCRRARDASLDTCLGAGPARAGLAGGTEAVLRADRAAGAAGGRQRLRRQDHADRNPLLDDPIFRRFFGVPGQQDDQMQRSLGSGVMVDPSGLVVTNVHVIEGADQVKVSLSDKREFEAEIVLKDSALRSRRVAPERLSREIPDARFRQFRRADGRRCRARDRQSLRRRPDRHPRHHLGPGAHASRHHRLPVLHPDRCADQSRQFRRRAGRHDRPPCRHQYRDLFALRRFAGHRFCDPRQHGACRGRVRQERRQGGEAAVAWRAAAGGDA